MFLKEEWKIAHTNDYVDVITFVFSKAWGVHDQMRHTVLPAEIIGIIIKGYFQPSSFSQTQFRLLCI